MAGFPFTIIHEIPPYGIRSYSQSAEKMRDITYVLVHIQNLHSFFF